MTKPTTNKAKFTNTGGPPAPFGWQGTKAARRTAGPYKAAPAPDLGGLEPGRLAEFEQGIKDGHHGLRTAAVMVGTYAAVRALQSWSPWGKHLR